MNERERLVEILKDNQGDNTYYMTDETVQSVSDVWCDGCGIIKETLYDKIYYNDKHVFDYRQYVGANNFNSKHSEI